MGASTSNEVKEHEVKNLNSEKTEVVQDEVKKLDYARSSVIRRTQIIIINKSRYPLVHSNHGDEDGYFFSDVMSAFCNESAFLNATHAKAIAPGRTGGILHTQKAGQDLYGSCGYVSFTVPTEGKNYVVCCAFFNTTLANTGAGVEIRGEDGVTDSLGRVAGHGVSPTGCVENITKLASKVKHATATSQFHRFVEQCRCFKVECEFTNNLASLFKFTISDV